jgi:arginyl-tRNA synthetase
MNSISTQLAPALEQIIQETFNASILEFEFQATRKEFEGDITLVVFGLLRTIKGNPVQIGETLGTALVERLEWVKGYNVVKGFLNIEITDAFFINELKEIRTTSNYGTVALDKASATVLVEYSSPNTNKPLHLGHVRNNLLGYAVANIIEAR